MKVPENHPLGHPDRITMLSFVKRGSRVLSAGCGTGKEVRFLKKMDCQVVGVDISKNIIKESRKIEPNAEYIKADLEDYRSDEKFDTIVCLFNTINFMDFSKRKKFIENSYYNLKVGGRLIITTENRFSSFYLFLWSILRQDLFHKIYNNSSRDYYYFPSQIDKWFSETSFKVYKHEYTYDSREKRLKTNDGRLLNLLPYFLKKDKIMIIVAIKK